MDSTRHIDPTTFSAAIAGTALGLTIVLAPTILGITIVGILVVVVALFPARRLLYFTDHWIELTIVVMPIVLVASPILATMFPSFLLTVVRSIIAASLIAIAFRERIRGQLPRVTTLIVLTFLASQVLAAFATVDRGSGLVAFVNTTMFMPALAISWTRRRQALFASGLAIALVALLLGVVAQVMALVCGTWGGLYSVDAVATRVIRYTSFLLNPNDLGLFAAMVVGGAAAMLATRRTPVSTFVLGTLMAGGVVTVLAAGSRGAVAAVALVLIVAAVLGLRHAGNVRSTVVIVAVVSVGTVGAAYGPFGETVVGSIRSFEGVVEGTDPSTKSRFGLWQDTTGLLTPIGGGYRRTAWSDGQTGIGAATGTVDNAWLKLLLESGAMGLAAMIVLMASAVGAGLRRAWRGDAFAAGACLALIAFLVRSTSADIFDITPWNALLWCLLGILLQRPIRA